MTFSMVLPGGVAVLIAVAAGHVRWSNKPAVAMRLLTAVAALASATALLLVVTVAAGFAERTSLGLALLERRPRLSLHHRVGNVEGTLAVALLAFMTFRSVRVIQRHLWAVRGTRGRHIAVLQTDEPIAYAAPGKPGCVDAWRPNDARMRQRLQPWAATAKSLRSPSAEQRWPRPRAMEQLERSGAAPFQHASKPCSMN